MAKKKSINDYLEEAMIPIENQLYEVPDNWIWTNLKSFASKIQYGYTSKSDLYGQGVKYLRITDLQYGTVDWSKVPFCEVTDKDFDKFKLKDGDIVVARTGATTGKNHLISSLEVNSVFASYLIRISPIKPINPQYLSWFMESNSYWQQISEVKNGIAQPGANAKKIGNLNVPMPPLNEQQRIVNRIESLFEKIDKAQELIEEARDGFEKRKEAILAKAFRGELTAKWREENQPELTQKEYYESVIKRRYEIVETKRELNDLNNLIENHDYKTHDLPKTWINMKSNMVCHNINCGSTPTKHISSSEVIPFLKVYNIVNNEIDFDYKPQFIPQDISQKKLKKSVLKPHDVIMNIVGPPLRKIAMIPDDYSEWNMNQAIVRLRPIEVIKSKYLYYALINKETLNDVVSETRGMVGQSNISVSQSRSLTIPLAPLDEQMKIVEILDRVMSDEKEIERLTTIKENIELLKKAILAKAFRGKLGTNDPNEESAIELLKQVLNENVNS